MKKDLAEVKAYVKAMAESNCVRDTYVDKEQDKFFRQLNRQRVCHCHGCLIQLSLDSFFYFANTGGRGGVTQGVN